MLLSECNKNEFEGKKIKDNYIGGQLLILKTLRGLFIIFKKIILK
jgi:hypothetical protein